MLVLAALLAQAKPLDPQIVLDRYTAHLASTHDPKNVIFTYSVTQVGPSNINQTHHIYRSGTLVRDETLAIEGRAPAVKITRISRYRNRYSIGNLAPRTSEYAFFFLRRVRSGDHYAYVYRTVPLGPALAYEVNRILIDSKRFLPSEIDFRTASGGVVGNGTIDFSGAGKYWIPTTVNIRAKVGKKSARERIAFSGYDFPRTLPKSTFQAPKPLPSPAIPGSG